LVVIINSLKVPKMKKILLYEMKFLVPNYSCLQNSSLVGCQAQIPVLSVLCPQLNFLNPPRTKFLGTPLPWIRRSVGGFSSRMHRFDPRPAHVGLEVQKVALR